MCCEDLVRMLIELETVEVLRVGIPESFIDRWKRTLREAIKDAKDKDPEEGS